MPRRWAESMSCAGRAWESSREKRGTPGGRARGQGLPVDKGERGSVQDGLGIGSFEQARQFYPTP
jgi:hypothetical protein